MDLAKALLSDPKAYVLAAFLAVALFTLGREIRSYKRHLRKQAATRRAEILLDL